LTLRRTRQTDLQAKNPETGPGAIASAKLEFFGWDGVDPEVLKKILWEALRPGARTPASVHGAAFLEGR
jgi:hypothetical protein